MIGQCKSNFIQRQRAENAAKRISPAQHKKFTDGVSMLLADLGILPHQRRASLSLQASECELPSACRAPLLDRQQAEIVHSAPHYSPNEEAEAMDDINGGGDGNPAQFST